ncbi:DUF397 domain-containing protein [Pseudonocardia nigra]|uniref:DUF397 domain-containing protein n=1 Tax=Pseudonocardia nigra TaxID=1921578 RepID=UPI001C5F4FE4|nr:DUF397 domain-containing protein [Pseudonocardia nigra]
MPSTDPDFTGATWVKSSFSGGNNGDCVEVAFVRDGVGVRDSKQHGRGPVLQFTPDEWTAFLAGVRAGEFDLP